MQFKIVKMIDFEIAEQSTGISIPDFRSVSIASVKINKEATMNKISMLQFQQHHNRQIIRSFQEDISIYKHMKSWSECIGDLDAEYLYHNLLQTAKRNLKKWVEIQKDCKQQIKEISLARLREVDADYNAWKAGL